MLHEISEIIDVVPFQMKLRFDSNEVRQVDFRKIFEDAKKYPQSVFNKLKDPAVFLNVKFNEEFKIIYWENLTTYRDLDGKQKAGPLEVSPEYLYEMSIPISTEKIHH